MKSETARVLKASYGPFFPDYQSELDRLVGLRLLRVIDMEWVAADQHFFGRFQISKEGVAFAERIAAASAFFSDTERAVSEIVSAFVANPRALSVVASRLDANLAQDTIREGQIVDFGEWQDDNYSREAADFLFEAWLHTVLKGRRDPDAAIRIPTSAAREDSQHEDFLSELTAVSARKAAPIESTLEPLTPSSPRRKAFHLYAHYLVHALAATPEELRRGERV